MPDSIFLTTYLTTQFHLVAKKVTSFCCVFRGRKQAAFEPIDSEAIEAHVDRADSKIDPTANKGLSPIRSCPSKSFSGH